MDHLSASSDKADIKGRAKYIAKRMRDIHFAAFCHFVADMFTILSRQTDKGGIEFQGIQMEGSLEGKDTRSGVGPSFCSEVNKAVDLCVNGLNERFGSLMNTPSTTSSRKQTLYGPPDFVQNLLVFNVNSCPAKDSDLIDFRDTNIERLVNWFDPALKSAECQVEDVIHQWHSLKIAVKAQFRDKDYGSLRKMLLSKEPYRSDLKDILHLVEILLVLPISAAGCERMVSAQNRIKHSLRASLKTQTLEGLIRISAQGPPLDNFDPAPSVNRWFAQDRCRRERQRRPNFSHSLK